MDNYQSSSQVKLIQAAFKTLLERKHLYQSVIVETIQSPDSVGDPIGTVRQDFLLTVRAFNGPWFLAGPTTVHRISPHASDERLLVTPPDLKLYCTSCGRSEAFNLVSVEDCFRHDGYSGGIEGHQAFVLLYRCQSCKGVPEIFLVRREGLKLTNTGRDPIEHVEVPKEVAKNHKKFFSGAIVAHQSGQTLAGLFLFRTLIEQFAREATSSQTRSADQVMSDYMATLPADFKDRFPSMKSLYDELSADLHAALASQELFERARLEIEEHFRARALFKLTKTASTSITG